MENEKSNSNNNTIEKIFFYLSRILTIIFIAIIICGSVTNAIVGIDFNIDGSHTMNGIPIFILSLIAYFMTFGLPIFALIFYQHYYIKKYKNK